MNVRVLYFASMRDQAGMEAESIDSSAPDASSLYSEVRTRHGFKLDESRLRVAINGAFADWKQTLREDDEIVFLPPVSGG